MAGDVISPVQWEAQAAERKKQEFAAHIVRDVPPRFRARIDLPAPVESWLTSRAKGDGLYLTGGVGTGKTHVAYETIMRMRETNQQEGPVGNRPGQVEGWGAEAPAAGHTEIWRATTLLDALRPGVDSARLTVDLCQRAGLLFLDDIGAEKPSEWTQERLYEVIDERYIGQRTLLVTSNVPPKALAEWVGERTASRLAEMCTVVPLLGSDRRRP